MRVRPETSRRWNVITAPARRTGFSCPLTLMRHARTSRRSQLMKKHTRNSTDSTPISPSKGGRNPLDRLISRYANVHGTAPVGEFSLRQWLLHITRGQWKKRILAVRTLYGDDEAYKAAKAELPCVTACGTFRRHTATDLQQHNGTVHADADHLTDEQIQTALARLTQD